MYADDAVVIPRFRGVVEAAAASMGWMLNTFKTSVETPSTLRFLKMTYSYWSEGASQAILGVDRSYRDGSRFQLLGSVYHGTVDAVGPRRLFQRSAFERRVAQTFFTHHNPRRIVNGPRKLWPGSIRAGVPFVASSLLRALNGRGRWLLPPVA